MTLRGYFPPQGSRLRLSYFAVGALILIVPSPFIDGRQPYLGQAALVAAAVSMSCFFAGLSLKVLGAFVRPARRKRGSRSRRNAHDTRKRILRRCSKSDAGSAGRPAIHQPSPTIAVGLHLRHLRAR